MKRTVLLITMVAGLFALSFCGDAVNVHLSSPPSGLKVIYISPGDSQTDISLDVVISIVFNQAVTESSLKSNISLIKIVGEETEIVKATGSYNAPAFETILIPGEDLEVGTTYRVTVKAAVEAVEGGNLPFDIIEYFTTTSVMVGQPLTVVSVDPFHGAVNLAEDVIPVITFNQTLDEATVTGAVSLSKVVSGGKDKDDEYEETDVEIEITGENSNAVTITPSALLEKGFEYAIIADGDIKSETGNSLGGYMESHFRIWTDEIIETDDDDNDDDDDDITDDDDDEVTDDDDDDVTDDDDNDE